MLSSLELNSNWRVLVYQLEHMCENIHKIGQNKSKIKAPVCRHIPGNKNILKILQSYLKTDVSLVSFLYNSSVVVQSQ